MTKDVCDLEIKDMYFEPEQELLILQCGLPRMGLLMVDWKSKEVFQTDLDLTLDDSFVKLVFNPIKSSQVLLVQKHSIQKLALHRKEFLGQRDDPTKVPWLYSTVLNR